MTKKWLRMPPTASHWIKKECFFTYEKHSYEARRPVFSTPVRAAFYRLTTCPPLVGAVNKPALPTLLQNGKADQGLVTGG
jgi:hypothetical protein